MADQLKINYLCLSTIRKTASTTYYDISISNDFLPSLSLYLMYTIYSTIYSMKMFKHLQLCITDLVCVCLFHSRILGWNLKRMSVYVCVFNWKRLREKYKRFAVHKSVLLDFRSLGVNWKLFILQKSGSNYNLQRSIQLAYSGTIRIALDNHKSLNLIAPPKAPNWNTAPARTKRGLFCIHTLGTVCGSKKVDWSTTMTMHRLIAQLKQMINGRRWDNCSPSTAHHTF